MENSILKIFGNGKFRILREVVYLISMIAWMIWYVLNSQNAIAQNASDVKKIKLDYGGSITELKEFKEEVGGDIKVIKNDIEWIRGKLE